MKATLIGRCCMMARRPDLDRRFFPVGYDASRSGLYAIEDRDDLDSLIRIDLAAELQPSRVLEHPGGRVDMRL